MAKKDMVVIVGNDGDWVAFNPSRVEAILYQDGELTVRLGEQELFARCSPEIAQKTVEACDEALNG